MKKLFLSILALVLGLSLFACGKHEDNFVETTSAGEPAEEIAILPNSAGESIKVEVPAESINPVVSGKTTYIRAKTDMLNVRQGAGTGYQSLGTLDKGDMVVYLGEENGWYKTYYRSKTAYVSANEKHTDLYEMDEGGEEIEKVIAVGTKLLGTPYVYGAVRYHNGNGKKLSGFTVNEFDCSSLMQYMFYIGAGKNLDLTTRTQIKQGVKVSELKRGDLMFFTNASRKNNTGIERVGHVAIYLGNNYILHTASDHAVIEEISATRWSYFIQAKRIIDN